MRLTLQNYITTQNNGTQNQFACNIYVLNESKKRNAA